MLCGKERTVLLLTWIFIMCSFIDRMTSYTGLPKFIPDHAMHISMMGKATSSNCRRGWKRKELIRPGFKVCEFIKEVVELFSPVCNSGVYKKMFYLLSQLAEDIRKSGNILVLYISFYEPFNDQGGVPMVN